MIASEFRKQVKNALEHLNDAAYLETHPLLTRLIVLHTGAPLSSGKQLRDILKAGIEALRPPSYVDANSPEWRCYRALHYRYVRGMNTGDIERELGIRTRQVQRELQKGLDALSSLLWSQHVSANIQAALSTQPSRIPIAPARLSSQSAGSWASPTPGAPLAAQYSGNPQSAIRNSQFVLLATKLAHPRLPAALVARDRLLCDLDAAVERRVILLSASAGWGKTTLLSAWANRHPSRVAWVSLDSLDNDPTRFWVAVISALRSCLPAAGDAALAMLHSPEPAPFSAFLTVLLNDLGSVGPAQPEPLLLILDDYHLIEHPSIQEAMTYLVEHLPPYLQILLATRVDPELPLARWRVRGELAEIRAADLRFTEAEAATFLERALGNALAEEDVRLLDARTEGWVAGLQLAALAMRQRDNLPEFVQAFTGSHRYLMDYVQGEILQRQPLPVQQFLLQTSVLRRLNAAVCEALMQETTSQAMLEWLERNNLFVVPLDDRREWYRVHDLFREVLLARLHATQPELVPRLHKRAARWYEAHGELREAIAHALSATDFSYAADLIEREAPRLWLGGEAHTVHTWIQALPNTILLQHARLALNASLRLLQSLHATVKEAYAGGQAQVEETIARLEAVLQPQRGQATEHEVVNPPSSFVLGIHNSQFVQPLPSLPDEEVALLKRRIGLLRALIASREALMRGNAELMHRLAQETEEYSKHEELSWKMVALSITFWLVESLQREGGILIPRLLEARRQAVEARDYAAMLRVTRWLAFAYTRASQLGLVQRECLEGLAMTEQVGEYSSMTGYFYYFLAGPLYSWNRLEDAAGAVQQVLRIGHAWQQADLLIVGNVFLASLALANHDWAAADNALRKAEELVRHERFATHSGTVVGLRAQYWLAMGDLDTASRWAQEVELSQEAWHPNRNWEVITLVRVYLAQEEHGRALELIERFRDRLDRLGNIETTVYFLALQLVALHRAGKFEQARAVAARLLGLTEPEGYIRVYLDFGEPMKKALQSLISSPRRDHDNDLPDASVAFVSKLLAALEQEALRLEQRGSNDGAAALRPQLEQSKSLAEPLTRREHEVLRLLVAGASNQEIATELVISMATVKKHVSNLLGKLGVASRAQAIVRARELAALS